MVLFYHQYYNLCIEAYHTFTYTANTHTIIKKYWNSEVFFIVVDELITHTTHLTYPVIMISGYVCAPRFQAPPLIGHS